MAKLVPQNNTEKLESSVFAERARILSGSGYLELEYIANEKILTELLEAKNETTNWIRVYFWIIGFNSSFFFTMMLTSMHYFESKYRAYSFAFLSMAAVKMPVFAALFLIVAFRRVSYSFQLVVGAIGFLSSFIATYQCAERMPHTRTGLFLVLLFQIFGSLFQFVFQANAIKIASFYHPRCISYYYASNALCAIVSSCVAFLAVYLKTSMDTFMIIFCSFAAGTVAICVISHLLLRRTPYYRKRINEEHKPEDGNWTQIWESLKKITMDLKTLIITVALTAITFRTVFYEIRPSFIVDSVWNNSVNIGVNVAEFFGRFQGYDSWYKPVIDFFYWYPWVYNILINGGYLWGNKEIYDNFWVLFSILLLFLCYRNGLAITYFVSKAVLETKDPNCGMIMNYGKGAGLAIGAIVSLAIGLLKHSLN